VSDAIRKLQNRAAEIVQRIDAIRSFEREEGSDEAKADATELDTLTAESAEVGAKLDRETQIEDQVRNLRGKLTLTEPRQAVTPVARPSAISMGSEFRHWADAGVSPEGVERCGHFLRSLARGEVRGAVATNGATEEPNSHGGLSPTYDTKNSELVVPDFYRGILGLLNYTSVAFQVASTMTTTTNRVVIPRSDENVEAQFYLENCEIEPVIIKTLGVPIPVEKIGARAQVSNELLEDAIVSVANLVATKFAYAFAKKIDKTWLEGDAAAGIVGLLAQVTQSVTLGATKLTVDNVVEAVSKLNPLAVNPVWVLSPAGMAMLQGLAAGAIGADVTQASRMTIFGSPVYRCLSLPDNVIGLYGDFKQANMIVNRSNGLTINASRERAIEYDQTVFVGTQRFGVATMGPSFVVKLTK
jgi:HK97 family phage major capsid protein